MSWISATFNSTIGKKLIMASSGLFLVLFLLGHVSGNTLLFRNDNGEAFNQYAYFMTHNPIVKILSWITYGSVILHVIYAIALTARNKKARPQAYHYSNPSANSSWSSRNMGILGSILLVFIIIHMRQFWYEMILGNQIDYVTYSDGIQYKNLYKIVVDTFQDGLYVSFYVISMAIVSFHLVHGFQSAFRTVGVHHPKYIPIIKNIGLAFSIIVPTLFAAMPIYLYLTK